MLKNSKKQKGDVLLLIAVIILSLFGLLMIYSASSFNAYKDYGDKFYFVKKQAVGLGVGFSFMIFTANFSYRKYAKISIPLMIVSLILLALVLTPLGVEVYGAKRWLRFGAITIQPSEIVKFAFIIFSASYYEKYDVGGSLFKSLPVLAVGGITCLLIMLEPNMSITVCVGLLMLAIVLLSGLKIKYFLMIVIPALCLLPVLIILEPYRLKRLSAFINPWSSPKGEGYQLIQSLYAISSGGLFGVGLFNSRQKYKFLPFAESDFILSIVGEELGFLGMICLIAVIIFIVYRGLKIASKSKNKFAYLTASGISLIFAIQAAVNILVISGSIPPTGLPMPLISAGNTSLIVFLGGFGILYNISKDLET